MRSFQSTTARSKYGELKCEMIEWRKLKTLDCSSHIQFNTNKGLTA